MLKLYFAGPTGHPLATEINVAGTTTSVGATVEAVQSREFDALLFPSEFAHPMRSIRASLSVDVAPSFIAVHERPSRAALVHALACGFDATVATAEGRDSVIDRIQHIVNGTWSFESEPWLRELGLTRGLLARDLILGEADDEQLVDLMGTGLPDDDIAHLMDWTIQRVRKRIAALLDENDLRYRTQLAVVRAASMKVTDFT